MGNLLLRFPLVLGLRHCKSVLFASFHIDDHLLRFGLDDVNLGLAIVHHRLFGPNGLMGKDNRVFSWQQFIIEGQIFHQIAAHFLAVYRAHIDIGRRMENAELIGVSRGAIPGLHIFQPATAASQPQHNQCQHQYFGIPLYSQPAIT